MPTSTPHTTNSYSKLSDLAVTGPVIYISPTGTGSGDNASQPTNLSQAKTMAAAGTTVIFLPGTYSTFSWTQGGAARNPVWLKAQHPAVTITDGTPVFAAPAQRTVLLGVNISADNVRVDGFYVNRQPMRLLGDRVLAIHNHIFESEESSFASTTDSVGIEIVSNFIENHELLTGSTNKAAHFGITTYKGQDYVIEGNVIDGWYFHTLAIREQSDGFIVAGNTFYDCGSGYCIQVSGGTDSDGPRDITSGSIQILNNRFRSRTDKAGKKAIGIVNIQNALVANNDFADFDFGITGTLYAPEGLPGQMGPIYPHDVILRENKFSGSALVLEGRGANGETVHLENNTGTATCTAAPFKPYTLTAADYQTGAKPQVFQTNDSFTCH